MVEHKGPALRSDNQSVVLEGHVRDCFSALCSSALPEHLQMQERQSFPRPAALTMSSCETKSKAKQVRVLSKLCEKVPALFWPKR